MNGTPLVTGADTSAIEDLKRRVAEFDARTTRVPTLDSLVRITAVGFKAGQLHVSRGGKNIWWSVVSGR